VDGTVGATTATISPKDHLSSKSLIATRFLTLRLCGHASALTGRTKPEPPPIFYQ